VELTSVEEEVEELLKLEASDWSWTTVETV